MKESILSTYENTKLDDTTLTLLKLAVKKNPKLFNTLVENKIPFPMEILENIKEMTSEQIYSNIKNTIDRSAINFNVIKRVPCKNCRKPTKEKHDTNFISGSNGTNGDIEENEEEKLKKSHFKNNQNSLSLYTDSSNIYKFEDDFNKINCNEDGSLEKRFKGENSFNQTSDFNHNYTDKTKNDDSNKSDSSANSTDRNINDNANNSDSSGNSTDKSKNDDKNKSDSSGNNKNKTNGDLNKIDPTVEKIDSDNNKTDSDNNKADSDKNKTDSDKNKTDSDNNKADSDKNKTDSDKNKTDSDNNKTDPNNNRTDPNNNRTDPNNNRIDSDKNKTDSNNNRIDSDNSNRTLHDNKTNCTYYSNGTIIGTNCPPRSSIENNINNTNCIIGLIGNSIDTNGDKFNGTIIDNFGTIMMNDGTIRIKNGTKVGKVAPFLHVKVIKNSNGTCFGSILNQAGLNETNNTGNSNLTDPIGSYGNENKINQTGQNQTNQTGQNEIKCTTDFPTMGPNQTIIIIKCKNGTVENPNFTSKNLTSSSNETKSNDSNSGDIKSKLCPNSLLNSIDILERLKLYNNIKPPITRSNYTNDDCKDNKTKCNNSVVDSLNKTIMSNEPIIKPNKSDNESSPNTENNTKETPSDPKKPDGPNPPDKPDPKETPSDPQRNNTDPKSNSTEPPNTKFDKNETFPEEDKNQTRSDSDNSTDSSEPQCIILNKT